MSKRTENWIFIKTPDDVEKIANPLCILQILGLQNVNVEIQNLKDRLNDVEQPLRKECILEALRIHGKAHTMQWFRNRLYTNETWTLCFSDLLALVQEGKLAEEKHGRVMVYRLAEARKG